MSDTVPNLWPARGFPVKVLTPLVIMRSQASRLTRMTKGVLEGEVTTTSVKTETSHRLQHQLDVIAPALGGYRHRLLAVTHGPDKVYPVSVRAVAALSPQEASCATESEFKKVVAKVLASDEVASVIEALLARSDEPTFANVEPVVAAR